MTRQSRRGLDPQDNRWFSKLQMKRLNKAIEEMIWLLDRAYPREQVSKFVGDRYQFSNRQREALKRSSCTTEQKKRRLMKQLALSQIEGQILHVDGFNIIILLEVALSGGTLVKGYDEQVRDLAGLRGSYKIIDETTMAIELMGRYLGLGNPTEVVIYLDAPISNSLKLKQLIITVGLKWPFKLNVLVMNKVDSHLMKQDYVVSSDAMILDACKSYVNLGKEILTREKLGQVCYDLTN